MCVFKRSQQPPLFTSLFGVSLWGRMLSATLQHSCQEYLCVQVEQALENYIFSPSLLLQKQPPAPDPMPVSRLPSQAQEMRLSRAALLPSRLPPRSEVGLIKLLPTLPHFPGNCTNQELMRNNEPAHRGREDNSERQESKLKGKCVLIARCR